MNISLSENIRSLRKERKLTQEQLAEVLGVTTGAVYKWESGLSIPELDMIVSMADFFDISVDHLLGYKMRDNRLDTLSERINIMLKSGNPEVINEVEKALKKYPYSFEVVYGSAKVYLFIGSQSDDKEKLQKALELFYQALSLLPQNTDPKINEFTIYGSIGDTYFVLGEREKGLEILKEHNIGGLFSDTIGTSLSVFQHRYDEALPYLEEAFFKGLFNTFNTTIGIALSNVERGENDKAKEMLLWTNDIIEGLSQNSDPGFLEKMKAYIMILLAYCHLKKHEKEEAAISVQKAVELTTFFDALEDQMHISLSFFDHAEIQIVFDMFSSEAEDGIDRLVELINNKELTDLWKEARGDD